MNGKNIEESDIRNMIIYWESHDMHGKRREENIKWFNGERNVSCCIINIVRNVCMQAGSCIKDLILNGRVTSVRKALHGHYIYGKNYEMVERIVVRFEDLKCKPEETLLSICGQLDIPWSHTLMMTTNHGKVSEYDNGEAMVSGFDLEPVYNLYEKYFSAADRLKIMVFEAPWQREYGYPYVELTQFSRKELQEMFLKKFRFQNLTAESTDNKAEINVQKFLRNWLQEVRMQESMW